MMNIHYSFKRSVFGVISVVALLSNIACGKKEDAKVAAAPPPPSVVIVEVEQRTVPIYSEFVGQTRAEETVELRARVEGTLQKIYFKEGTPVRKGQLLFTIDQRPFAAALQSAKAIEAKAQSDLAQARQRVDVLQAQAELADAQAVLSRAEQDLARLRPLAEQKAVTEVDLDAAIAAEKSARATVDARRANLTNLDAAVKYTIERANAEVSAAKARVIQAQLDLSYCTITSPINGMIGFIQVDEGNLVGRNEATLLATVSLSNPLLVDFNLSEIDFLKLTDPDTYNTRASDLRFELILSDDSVHPSPGTFKVVDRAVDPTTGTMKVEAVFPNPGSYLRPGQFARLRVPVAERKDAILVPQRAVQELQGAKTVMVVDAQNIVQLRTIRVGDKSENNLIVLEGLSKGERVIVEGMQKARPGGEVKPTTAESVATDATPTKSGS
ncbi:MAG TPA: efflux RND transporter periplasmic adaptor subunit [Pyrinomonadaceae bacterium]|nr:efflux RND transporter periplasmic adaptor subunit [Pyrinomonadaceae bacterium]